MSYAFVFDARACSGCKACQEACKDRSALPLGVIWRRVVEVSGGGWQRQGDAWQNSVFAYNLSLACNHCEHPKCAGVCPTNAYSVRPDGIVLLDPDRCMGCGYCAWVCPYGAPQYDGERGVMGKCDLCYTELDAGLPPSCVAACPLRALSLIRLEDTPASNDLQPLWLQPAGEHPFPLPAFSRTEPHLAVRPHPAMLNTLEKNIANREEILPPANTRPPSEAPLVAFTLLAQAAAGISLASLLIASLPLALLLLIGALLSAAGLVSFLHLGRKRNAWRAVLHLKKSWLSREVLLAGLFAAAWALAAGFALAQPAVPAPLRWLLAGLGLAFIDSMSRIYRFKAAPAWNTWRTPAGFFLSAACLGTLAVNLFAPSPLWLVLAALALALEGVLALASAPSLPKTWHLSLLALACLLALTALFFPAAGIPALLAALAAEALGRSRFYALRQPALF